MREIEIDTDRESEREGEKKRITCLLINFNNIHFEHVNWNTYWRNNKLMTYFVIKFKY